MKKIIISILCLNLLACVSNATIAAGVYSSEELMKLFPEAITNVSTKF